MSHEESPEAGAGRTVAPSLFASALMVFAANLLARALGLLFPLLVAHALSRPDFATVYFFISTGFFVGELVLTGFPTAVTRQVAVANDPSAGRWLRAGMVGGIPLLVIAAAGGELLAVSASAPPGLTTVVVVGLTIDAYYFAALRGLQRFRTLVAYRILANAVQILLLGIVVAVGAAAVPVVTVIYAAVYLVPIVGIELGWRTVSTLFRNAGSWGWPELMVLTRFALPALASGVAYGTILGLDVFFVRLFAPDSLADYGAARALAMPMLMVPYAIGIVLLPRAAAASKDSRFGMLLRAELVGLGGGLVLVLAYFVAGPWLIRLALPAEYSASLEALNVLVPALLVLGLYSILSQWWFARNRPITPAITLGIGAAVAVGGHATATAALGVIGAGAAIGLGSAIALSLLGVATWRARE